MMLFSSSTPWTCNRQFTTLLLAPATITPDLQCQRTLGSGTAGISNPIAFRSLYSDLGYWLLCEALSVGTNGCYLLEPSQGTINRVSLGNNTHDFRALAQLVSTSDGEPRILAHASPDGADVFSLGNSTQALSSATSEYHANLATDYFNGASG